MFSRLFLSDYCLGVFTAAEDCKLPNELEAHRSPLHTAEAAIYLNVKPNYLERCRCDGDGPVFIKRNGLVRYDPADLDAWLEAGKRKSTSDGEQYCLVDEGNIVVGPTYKPDLLDKRRGTWLPVVNVDTEPLDPARHWRLAPLPLRIDGDRVMREWPVVLKNWEHA
jgi:hypothetical protein